MSVRMFVSVCEGLRSAERDPGQALPRRFPGIEEAVM